MVYIHSKGHIEGPKGRIWAFVIYLHQYLRNGACYNHSLYIVSHVWSLSRHLTLDVL